MADKTISPEIVKLMDKMTQNPTSRLFVPLAEEYLKCGMVDEAVIVLAEGIKNHPNYVAARIMLGKTYLQKNQIAEAQAEFEQVIAISPDNILAHKKLAVIHQKQGEPQRALEACKKALMIDPSDKEAKGLVRVLEKASASSTQPEAAAPWSPSPPVETHSPVSEAQRKEADPVFPVEPAQRVEDVSMPVSSQEAPIERPVAAENLPAQEDSWAEDKTVVAGFEIPSLEKEPLSSPDAEASSTPDKDDQKEGPLFSTTLASLYMSQGHYQEAAEVYQKLLAQDPSDEESRQGLEIVLRHLAPGQGAEAAFQEGSGPEDSKKKKVQRLQSWLDSIRKKNEL